MRNDDRPMKNPSYDKSLLPEVRFADFLGAYCIRLNSFNTPPSSQEAKQAIVEFVTKDLFDDTRLADIDRLLGALEPLAEEWGYRIGIGDLPNEMPERIRIAHQTHKELRETYPKEAE